MFLSHIKHIKKCYNKKYKQINFISNALINFISFKISITIDIEKYTELLRLFYELCNLF